MDTGPLKIKISPFYNFEWQTTSKGSQWLPCYQEGAQLAPIILDWHHCMHESLMCVFFLVYNRYRMQCVCVSVFDLLGFYLSCGIVRCFLEMGTEVPKKMHDAAAVPGKELACSDRYLHRGLHVLTQPKSRTVGLHLAVTARPRLILHS